MPREGSTYPRVQWG